MPVLLRDTIAARDDAGTRPIHAALEAPWHAARFRIALVPAECLGAFLQHLDHGEEVIGQGAVLRFRLVQLGVPVGGGQKLVPRPGRIEESELDRILAGRLRQLIDQNFKGPLDLLLGAAAIAGDHGRVALVAVGNLFPVRDARRVELELVLRHFTGHVLRQRVDVSGNHVELVAQRVDGSIPLQPDLEPRERLRLVGDRIELFGLVSTALTGRPVTLARCATSPQNGE